MPCCGTALPSRGELVASILLAGGITLVLAGSNLSKHSAARREFRPASSFASSGDNADILAQRRARMLQTFRTGELSKEQATAARLASADERLRSIRAALEAQPVAEEKREEEAPALLETEEEQMHKMFSANYRGGRSDTGDDGAEASMAAPTQATEAAAAAASTT